MHKILKITLLYIFFCLCYSLENEIEYIIYTSANLQESAEILKNYYNNPSLYNYSGLNPDSIKLNTEIITSNNVTPENFNTYIYNNFADDQNNFTYLKYLLIIGDENIIEPIKFQNIAPSDDYFSSKIVSLNTFPIPELRTGRILVDNNYDAQVIINNIINYINNPFKGSWKSESLLFCDNIYKNGKQIYEEIVHTEYSEIVYNKLKNNMIISSLNGNDFPMIESTDWYIQPELNNQIIQRLNQGLSLVNYIGHGTSNLLADEDILTFSDINSISINNNKLPIWVVGTCSFGNYLNQNCFSEELMKKGDAAIAIISTTYNVSYDNNWLYISNFYTKVDEYINHQNDFYRIGDLFYESKSLGGESYIFHLFGDPAMPINISRKSFSLIQEIPEIEIGSYNNVISTNDSLTTIKINTVDNINEIFYDDINGLSQTLAYSTPGDILFFEEFYNNSQFILPLTINTSNELQIKIQNDMNNSFQYIGNINLSINDEIENYNSNGPNIYIEHKNKIITNGDEIYPPYNIKINFESEIPINLNNINNNNIRVWIDNKDDESINLNDYFRPDESLNDYGGYIDFNLSEHFELSKNIELKIQAWDILGESSTFEIILNLFNDTPVFNVFNFPNPFNDITYFTFHYSESQNLDVIINIYTLHGKKIKTIKENNLIPIESTFYRMTESWDGRDYNSKKINNGTYLYELKLSNSSDGKNIFNKTFTLTKID